MNYPVWYLPQTVGGILIAVIAVLHVFVSHFAVGGGLYLIFAEKKGLRENSKPILEFTKKHARFFILLTMVFGAISGVGIWFIISLVNPAATSLLIHNFIFGWAAEWVFFAVEIAAAFVYYYMFDRMDSATHIKVGWLYFIAAWLSLFLINGIIGFMLTPGDWIENKNFWSGLFNPSFWPALFMRTFLAIMIAACYGYFSASLEKEQSVKTSMTTFSANWALTGLSLCIPAGFWYLSTLPESARSLIYGQSPTISMFLPIGLWASILLLFIMLIAGRIKTAWNYKPVALVSLLAALGMMASFEGIREAARRPYVIYDMMYANAIPKKDAEQINQQGFLKKARWVQHRKLDKDNLIAAGEELFINQCYACHTYGGDVNDLKARTQPMSFQALKSYILTLHKKRFFMPPFFGTEEEITALVAFLKNKLPPPEKALHAHQEIPTTNNLHIGKTIFEENCTFCHGLDQVGATFSNRTQQESVKILRALDRISAIMQPFHGSEEETQQLANYLIEASKPEQSTGKGDAQ